MTLEIKVWGIPWYEEADYDELRRIFDDGDSLHGTYREWLEAAEMAERRLSTGGTRVVRAQIRPREFKAWCNAEGLKLDSNARNKFANLAAARSVMGGTN